MKPHNMLEMMSDEEKRCFFGWKQYNLTESWVQQTSDHLQCCLQSFKVVKLLLAQLYIFLEWMVGRWIGITAYHYCILKKSSGV